MNSASDNCSNNSATMVPLQQSTGVVAGANRTIRWAAIGEGPFIHAEDLCNALGWRRPDRVLKALSQHIVTAGLLGIEPSFPEDRFINKNGADELFARRTGGGTYDVRCLVRARIYGEEGVEIPDNVEEEEAPADPQDEPLIPMSEVAAMEALAQKRAETALIQAQSLKARVEVLHEYRALGGPHDLNYESARQSLFDDMLRPYAGQYISLQEYIQFQGFPAAAAASLAATFGPDVKRVYRAEHGRDPQTYVSVFPMSTSRVCLYDRFRDIELLGSCWRNFQKHRAWYKERHESSTQRRVDAQRLISMSQEAGAPAPGWGPARTQRLAITSAPF